MPAIVDPLKEIASFLPEVKPSYSSPPPPPPPPPQQPPLDPDCDTVPIMYSEELYPEIELKTSQQGQLQDCVIVPIELLSEVEPGLSRVSQRPKQPYEQLHQPPYSEELYPEVELKTSQQGQPQDCEIVPIELLPEVEPGLSRVSQRPKQPYAQPYQPPHSEELYPEVELKTSQQGQSQDCVIPIELLPGVEPGLPRVSQRPKQPYEQPYPPPGGPGYYYQPPQQYAPYGPSPSVQQPGPVAVTVVARDTRDSARYQRNTDQRREDNTRWASDTFESSFDDAQIRSKFIQKVYFILMCQMIVTTLMIALFVFHNPTRSFVQHHSFLIYLAFIVYIVIYIALVCCDNLRRQHPLNLILLAIFTFAMAFITAVISAHYDTKIVFFAFGMTALVCLSVTLLAILAPCDITGCGAYLCVAGLALVVFGLVAVIVNLFIDMPILIVVYSSIAVVLFSLYLMYDTQQIMGGRKIELSPEEYVYGALQLYMDMILIFTHLLTLIGMLSND